LTYFTFATEAVTGILIIVCYVALLGVRDLGLAIFFTYTNLSKDPRPALERILPLGTWKLGWRVILVILIATLAVDPIRLVLFRPDRAGF
jgi:hypothetical protein